MVQAFKFNWNDPAVSRVPPQLFHYLSLSQLSPRTAAKFPGDVTAHLVSALHPALLARSFSPLVVP